MNVIKQSIETVNIGDKFTYRHNGKHNDCILVVKADGNGKKILFNETYGIQIGEIALSYKRCKKIVD